MDIKLYFRLVITILGTFIIIAISGIVLKNFFNDGKIFETPIITSTNNRKVTHADSAFASDGVLNYDRTTIKDESKKVAVKKPIKTLSPTPTPNNDSIIVTIAPTTETPTPTPSITPTPTSSITPTPTSTITPTATPLITPPKTLHGNPQPTHKKENKDTIPN